MCQGPAPAESDTLCFVCAHSPRVQSCSRHTGARSGKACGSLHGSVEKKNSFKQESVILERYSLCSIICFTERRSSGRALRPMTSILITGAPYCADRCSAAFHLKISGIITSAGLDSGSLYAMDIASQEITMPSSAAFEARGTDRKRKALLPAGHL